VDIWERTRRQGCDADAKECKDRREKYGDFEIVGGILGEPAV
jgi:hypothetical protein